MACKIEYHKNGKINKVLDKNGNKSKLFQKIFNTSILSLEDSIEAYKNIYSKQLQDIDENTAEIIFKNSNGEIFTSYQTALQNTPEGVLQAIINNDKVIFSVDVNTDNNTFEGTINDLVKQNLFTGERILEVNGDISYITSGESFNRKVSNASIIDEMVYKNFGRDNVKWKDDNNFVLSKPTQNTLDTRNLNYQDLVKKIGSEQAIYRVAENTYIQEVKPFAGKKVLTNEEIEFFPEDKIKTSLIKLLNDMGVKITSIEDYIKNYKLKNNNVEPSAQALADLSNRVIAFRNGEIDTSLLTEEVAHFIVETFNQDEITNLLRNIHRTEQWDKYSLAYVDVYKNDDNALRKEILGKVLAENLLINFQTSETKTDTENSIINKIKQLFNAFFDKISAYLKPQHLQDLQKFSDQIYNNILANELINELNLEQLEGNKLTLYSLEQDLKDKTFQIYSRANKAVDLLIKQSKQLKIAGASSPKTLEDIRNSIEKEDEKKAVSGVVMVAKKHINYLLRAYDKNKQTIYPFSNEEKIVYLTTKGSLKTILGELMVLKQQDKQTLTGEWKIILDDIKDTILRIEQLEASVELSKNSPIKLLIKDIGIKNSWSEEEQSDILEQIEGIRNDEKSAEKLAKKFRFNETQTKNLKEAFKLMGTQEKRVTSNDKFIRDFINSNGFTPSQAEDFAKHLDLIKKDTSWLLSYISSMTHANDTVLNLASSIISKMTTDSTINSYEGNKEFNNKLNALGADTKKLGNFMSEGYIDDVIDWKRLEQDRIVAKTGIYNEINNNSNLTPEQFEQLNKNNNLELSVENKRKFDYLYEKWSLENEKEDALKPEERKIKNDLLDLFSLETRAFSRDQSSRKGLIANKALENGGYTNEDKILLEELKYEREKVKNPFDSNGNLKKGIILSEDNNTLFLDENNYSEEAKLAVELTELDNIQFLMFKYPELKSKGIEVYRDMYRTGIIPLETNSDTATTNVLPQKFKDKINELENDFEEQISFFNLNTNLSLSNKFWDNLPENVSLVDKVNNLIESGAIEKQEDIDKIKEHISHLNKLNKRKSSILKANKVYNNSLEVSIEMPYNDQLAIKDIVETTQDITSLLNQYLPKEERIIEFQESNLEVDVNKAWNQYVTDRNLSSENIDEYLTEVKKHVTKYDSVKIDGAKNLANQIIKGYVTEVPQGFSRFFNLESYSNITNKEDLKSTVNRDLANYAQSKLLPYFKRVGAKQVGGVDYQNLMNSVQAGVVKLSDFLDGVEKGFYPELNVTPNFIFNDENVENMNPKFLDNQKKGLPQIKDKYKSSRFEDKYGEILYDEDGNEIGSTKNQNDFKVLQVIKAHKKEIHELTNMTRSNLALAPQFGMRGFRQVEELFKKAKTSTAKEIIKDLTTYREDEAMYGQSVSGEALMSREGELTIPKLGFRKLENQEDLADDLFASLTLMYHEAQLHKARVNAFAEIEAVREIVLEGNYGAKEAEATRTYKMFDDFVRTNFYGQQESFEYHTDFFGLLSKKKNLAPVAKKFQGWVRLVNLGFGIITPLTSFLQGSINFTMERILGEKLNTDAVSLGRRKVASWLSNSTKDIFQTRSVSEMSSVLERYGLYDLQENYNKAQYSSWVRGLTKIDFLSHKLADTPLKALVGLSVLHDYRVVNGDIIGFNQFKKQYVNKGKSQKELKTEWKSFEDNVWYNYLDTVDGVTKPNLEKLRNDLQIENEEEFLNLVKLKEQAISETMKLTATEIDTQVSKEDRSHAQRHAIFSFFFLHKGWYTVAYNRKLKGRHTQFQGLGLEEEGNWYGMSKFITEMLQEFKDPTKRKDFLKSIKEQWNNADDVRKLSVKRTAVEIAFTSTMVLLSLLAMNAADDDDDKDWLTQFGAYMAYRTTNETISMSTAYPNQVFEFLEAPIIGLDKLQHVSTIWDIGSDEIIKQGRYRGETERARFFFKGLPLFKEYYKVTRIDRERDSYEFYNKDNYKWTLVAWMMEKDKKE